MKLGVKNFMKHGPIILSEDGSKIFEAHEAWERHVIKDGIKDAFKELQKLHDEHTHYHYNNYGNTTIIIDDMTDEQKTREKELKEYRNEFMTEREIWTGQYILNTYGYNTLITFAQSHRQGETAAIYDRKFWEWFEHVLPCKGKDGQCLIFCPNFNDCDKI